MDNSSNSKGGICIMTEELGNIAELREVEQTLWQFMRMYYKVKGVRERLESTS